MSFRRNFAGLITMFLLFSCGTTNASSVPNASSPDTLDSKQIIDSSSGISSNSASEDNGTHVHEYNNIGDCVVDGCNDSICYKEECHEPDTYEKAILKIRDHKAYFSFSTICNSKFYLNTQDYLEEDEESDYPINLINDIHIYKEDDLENDISSIFFISAECLSYWSYSGVKAFDKEVAYYCVLDINARYGEDTIDVYLKNSSRHDFSDWKTDKDGKEYRTCSSCRVNEYKTEDKDE